MILIQISAISFLYITNEPLTTGGMMVTQNPVYISFPLYLFFRISM